ncbi:hypothetical protein MVEN_02553100 [Mycena venus]|uniref:Uncharacterized protein n=1 Tax=Mycena venus TaxID=2733690 RepID=A0A8H6U4Z6_9AGAR|nr:hypothetical protein MVEN_02553100 [Mycena venus]
MSILVDSVYTSSVKLSTYSQTVLSRHFASLHLPSHASSLYAFTINGGPHGPFTTVLDCSVSASSTADVSLGLDWKASMREWFIDLGLSPTHGFELENLRAIPRVSAEATVGDGPPGVSSSKSSMSCLISQLAVAPPSSAVLSTLSAASSSFPAAPLSSAPKHGMSFLQRCVRWLPPLELRRSPARTPCYLAYTHTRAHILRWTCVRACQLLSPYVCV